MLHNDYAFTPLLFKANSRRDGLPLSIPITVPCSQSSKEQKTHDRGTLHKTNVKPSYLKLLRVIIRSNTYLELSGGQYQCLGCHRITSTFSKSGSPHLRWGNRRFSGRQISLTECWGSALILRMLARVDDVVWVCKFQFEMVSEVSRCSSETIIDK